MVSGSPVESAGEAASISSEPSSAGQSVGALYVPIHAERRVKIYPIQEHELTNLAVLSTVVTVCAAIASGTLAFMLSVVWDMAISTQPDVQKAGNGFLAICGVVIVGCVGIGIWAHCSRGGQLKKILTESTVR